MATALNTLFWFSPRMVVALQEAGPRAGFFLLLATRNFPSATTWPNSSITGALADVNIHPWLMVPLRFPCCLKRVISHLTEKIG